MTNAFKRLAKEAGLPRIRLHDLRHTWATLVLRAGLPAKVVAAQLGHSSVAITLDVYSHVEGSMQRGAAEQVAELRCEAPREPLS